MVLEANLSNIKGYFWGVLIRMPRFYCFIKCTCLLHSMDLNLDTSKTILWKMKQASDKKRHIFVFGYLWELFRIIPRFFLSDSEFSFSLFSDFWINILNVGFVNGPKKYLKLKKVMQQHIWIKIMACGKSI